MYTKMSLCHSSILGYLLMVLVLIGEILSGNSLLRGLASNTTPLHRRECTYHSGF